MVKSIFLLLLSVVIGSRVAADDSPIRIGLLAALTGEPASIGEDCRRGYELGMSNVLPDKKLGLRRIVPRYGDHRGEGKSAITEFQRLVNTEKVPVVISHHSQPTMQINQIARAQGIPLIGVLAHGQFLTANPIAWRFWPSTTQEAKALLHAVQDKKVSRIAAISVQDEYTLSLRDELQKGLREFDSKFVFNQEILRTDNDFRSLITGLKKSQPEGIFVNVAIPQLGPFLKQLEEMGVSVPIFGNVWLMTPDVQLYSSREIFKNVIFSQLNADKPKFLEQFRQMFPNQTPSVIQYACFAAITGLLEATKSINGPIDSAAIITALNKLKAVQLPDESLPILGHEAQFGMKLMTFRNGIYVDYVASGQ